jgi:hypothetical protein
VSRKRTCIHPIEVLKPNDGAKIAFRSATSKPQHVDRRLCRDRIPIQGNDREPMAWQRQGGPHARAGIEQPEKNALPLLHANGIPVSEHPVAESGRVIHDLKPIIGWRHFANILHADPLALPKMRGEQHLAVIAAGVTRRRFDASLES